MNEELARLGHTHRLLYAGLWLLADREGRLEDRPRRIRAALFAYEPSIDLEPLLVSLEEAGFIQRYQIDGRALIQIPTFLRHQTPHFKEAASELPAPPGHQGSGIIAFGFSPKQRERILARDNHRCVKCGAGDHLAIDHVVPRSRGGSGEDSNLQVLCTRCNSKKGNKLTLESPAEGSVLPETMIEACMPQSSTARSPVSVLVLDPVSDPESVPDPVAVPSAKDQSSPAPKTRETARPPETADENLKIITRIAHQTFDELGLANPDVTEAVKERCAKLKIAYSGSVVRKAVDSAAWQRTHR